MADVRIRLSAENRASREIEQLRREVQQLQQQMGTTQRAADAAGNEVQQLGTHSQRAAQGIDTLGDEAQQTTVQITRLSEQSRRAEASMMQASRGTGRFGGALGDLRGIIAGVGFAVVGQQVLEFGRSAVDAAVRVEGFQNSLTALYGDAEIAARVLMGLEDASQLPGITLEGAVSGAIRLKTVGVEGERAQRILVEWGNAAALSGQSADEMSRSVIGLTQTMARGALDAENLNQIFENTPLIAQSVQSAFGSIDAEVIRNQLDAAGQSVNDFVDILVNELSMGARASAESTANAFSNLRNASFQLQAAVGEQLLEGVRGATLGLTEFLDTIREGIDDVSTLPEPIQEIIAGAQALLDALSSVGTTISGVLGPPLQFLAEELGGLLGAVLELAGALYQSLEPILQGLYTVIGVVVTAVAQLAEHITVVIRGITDLVNWVSFWNDENAEAAASTENLTQTVGAATAALDANATATERQAARLTDLRTALDTANAEVERYEAALAKAREEAVGETNPAIQQLERRLAAARQTQSEATAEVVKAEGALEKQATATESVTTATTEAEVAVRSYAEILRTLEQNIVAAEAAQNRIRENLEFWTFAATAAGGYTAEIGRTTVAVSDHEAELEALTNAGFWDGLDDPVAEYAAALTTTSEAANNALDPITNINEVVIETGGNIRTAEERLRDFDSAFQLSEATIPRVTSAMRAFTGTAPDIDRVRVAVEATTRSVVDLLDEIEAVGDGTEALGSIEAAFVGLGEDTVPRVTRSIIDAFVDIAEGDEINDAFGDLGDRIGNTLVDELSGVLSQQLSGAVIGNLPGIISGAGGIGTTLIGAAGALAAPVGIFAAAVAGFALVSETLIRAFPTETVQDPITPADVLRAGGRNVQGLGLELNLDFTQGVPDFSQTDPELLRLLGIDPATAQAPSTRGTGTNLFRIASGDEAARRTAEATGTDRQAIEDIARAMYGEEAYDEEVAAATGEAIAETIEDAIPDADELRDVFRFTGAQRARLGVLADDIEAAEDDIRLLTEDSSPEEVIAAYQALGAAETAYYQQQLAFIDEGEDIFTDSALQTARQTAAGDLRANLFDANQLLSRALGSIGQELVNAFTATSGFLMGSALAFQEIPEAIADADAPEEERQILSNVHRFTSDQSNVLGGLRQRIAIAQTAVDRLNENSSQAEIAAAYTELAAAEQALYDQEVAFITNATGITEDARTNALTLAQQRFESEIFDANEDLVGALEGIGLQLTTTITDWFAILSGVALQVQEIPDPEVPAEAEEAAPLRDVFRFTGAQQDALRTLRGDVTAAEAELRRLRSDDTATEEQLTAAYTALTEASAAVLEQEVRFITSATNITDDARQNAFVQAGQRFGNEVFDANTALVNGLANLGLELTTTITNWRGVLVGAFLDVQEIPDIAETDTETPGINTNLLQNAIERARFNLTGATTEQGFETARQELISAINEFYDAEEDRIESLGLAEEDLEDRREDNQLARDRALRSAMTTENRFTQERIRNNERATQEATRLAQQEAQDRLRTEQRLQDRIDDLRDEAIGTEQGRLEAIAGLNEQHQDRLTEIERDGLRAREDLQRDFSRGIEDIFRDAGFDEPFFRSGDFQRLLRSASSPDQDTFRAELDRFGIDVSEDDLDRIRNLAVRQQRRQQDIGRRAARQVSDLERNTAERREDINAQADATARAIRTELEPLFTQRASSPVETQRTTTADKEATTADTQATTAGIEADTAIANKTVAEMFGPAVQTFGTATESLLQTSTELRATDFGAIAEAVGRIPDAIDGLRTAVITLPGQLADSLFNTFERIGREAGGPLLDLEAQATLHPLLSDPALLELTQPTALPEMVEFVSPAEIPNFTELSVTAGVVNVNGTISGLSGGGAGGGGNVNVTIPLYLDGKEFGRAAVDNIVGDNQNISRIEGTLVNRSNRNRSLLQT